MRPVQFDNETVIQAGKDLEAAGRSVTGFAIRQKVGGGNPTRLKQVWDEHKSSVSVEVSVPVTELPGEVAEELETVTTALTKRLHALASELHQKAVKAAQVMVNDVLKSAGEQRQQADRELQDAAQTVDDLEKQLDASEAKILDLAKDLDLSQTNAQANAVEIARLNERLVASAQLAAEFADFKKSTAAASQVHQSAMTAIEAELAQVRGERESLVKDLASAQAKSAADDQASVDSLKRTERVEAELAKVRGEREALVKDLANAQAKAAADKEAGVESSKRTERVEAELAKVRAEHDDARKQASTAREEAAKLAGKVEALERQIDKLAGKSAK